jgi:hypothetical protein
MFADNSIFSLGGNLNTRVEDVLIMKLMWIRLKYFLILNKMFL